MQQAESTAGGKLKLKSIYVGRGSHYIYGKGYRRPQGARDRTGRNTETDQKGAAYKGMDLQAPDAGRRFLRT